jgi:hypothetical protein
MRALGFLFIVVLIVAAIGLFQGWFSVSSTHAAGKTGVELSVDKDKMTHDTGSVANEVGRIGREAADKIKQLAHRTGPKDSELDGNVSAVDAVGRKLTVTTGNTGLELHVPADVPVTRDGATVDLASLQPGTHVKVGLKHSGDDLVVSSVTVVP